MASKDPKFSTGTRLSKNMTTIVLSRNSLLILSGGVIVGILFISIGLYFSPQRTWFNILLNNYYFLSLAITGTIWIAIQYVSNAGWGVMIKRIPEGMTAFLPVSSIIMLLLYFGVHALYKWTDETLVAENPLLQWKQVYLNVPFFFIRVLIFMILWMGFSWGIIRNSLRQDTNGSIDFTRKNVRLSALFLVLFAFTFVLASFDWIMSLEPEWYSSVFPIYIFSGLFLNGISAITIIVIVMRRAGMLPLVNENHLNDLGKLLFAFSIFWAYIWFSQYMLIWYANISEEASFFVRRMQGGWSYLFYLNVILNWFIPFISLIARSTKRNEKILFRICLVVMIGHWVDLYTLIMPVFEQTPQFGLPEIFSFLGFLSSFIVVLYWRLARVPLVPAKDPYLEESIHLHV